ncbi:chromosome segregation protein SMC [bacterium]|nr:chromosome segregation protein SMC [bacterium]
MYFKSLVMQGFKSFADETKLEFEPGLTAIVGPNGCGKSNISDAIRWTLGEQRPTALRLSKIEDIIFSGSEARKPLGLAEVSLTVTNEDKRLPIEFTEVTITRRLFRSGESEYYINKAPVRLKDIQELFMDTGLGSSTYSLIEQGKIELILSSKPEDRRFLFEEAAGISKYKHRREETLRKLEATQENLLRLDDVTGEVKRQINSLKRQVGKAERYQEIKDELKDLELNLGVIEFRELKKRKESSSQGLEKFQDERESLEGRIRETEETLKNIQEKAREIETTLYEAHQKVFKIESEIERSKDRIATYQERGEGLEDEGGRRKKEIEDLKEKRKSLEGEIGGREEELKSLSIQIEEESARSKKEEKSLKGLNKELGEDIEALEALKNEVIETLSTTANTRNDLRYLETGQRNVDIRRERLLTEKTKIGEETKDVEGKAKEIEKSIENHRKKISEFEEEKKSLLERERKDREELLDFGEKIDRLKTQIAKKTSHLEFLQEGPGGGVREALLARDGLSGIEGAIIDLIQTSPEYERAIEAALGERIENIVTRDMKSAREALEYLKARNLGRATFLPLQAVKPDRKLNPSSLVKEEGAIGLASGLVKCEARYRPIIEYLLGNVLVVKDLDAAFELGKKTKENIRIVTLEGEIVTPQGEITGGSLRRLLGREGGKGELAREIKALGENLKKLEEDRTNLEKKGLEKRDEISSIDSHVKKEELEMNLKERDLASIVSQKERVNKDLSFLKTEGEELDKEGEGLAKKRKEQETRLENLGEKEIGTQEKITKLKEEMGVREEEISKVSSEVTNLKVSLASLVEKETGLRENLGRMRENLKDLTRSIEAREGEIDEGKTRKEEFSDLITKEEKKQKELLREREETEKRLENLKRKKEEITDEVSKKEEELREIRVLGEKLQGESNELSFQGRELDLGTENLARRVKENYGVSLEEIEGNYQVPEIEDREGYKAKIRELREKIEALGLVNLVAIEEYKELEERYNFLTGQKKDLEEATVSLKEAIAKINRTTRSLFSKTFEQIRENFNQVFQRLFEGGKADLILIDERNILESGIEIKARPPGRTSRNISLLSGGEKALTAIALLFGIFMVKPSPFCVLDEIDAALDEANVSRFTRVLAEFAKKSQFIVVTHNRGTIEASDTMYGVTMEESGVSKLVSVKFAQEEIEKQRREEKKSKVQSPPDKQGRKESGSPLHSEKS